MHGKGPWLVQWFGKRIDTELLAQEAELHKPHDAETDIIDASMTVSPPSDIEGTYLINSVNREFYDSNNEGYQITLWISKTVMAPTQ